MSGPNFCAAFPLAKCLTPVSQETHNENNTTNNSKKRYFDLAVIIPLEEEVEEFVNYFEMDEDLSTDTILR